MTTINELIDFVQELHDRGAYHRKRGFSLHDSTRELASNHMLEETVELQAEAILTQNRTAIIEESADVLATWLHLLIHCDVTLDEVIDRCDSKLREAFTYDSDEIKTNTPGLTRRNRQNTKDEV